MINVSPGVTLINSSGKMVDQVDREDRIQEKICKK